MIRLFCVAIFALGSTISAAWAHHSFAMFDQDKELKLEGTVTEFKFINPHTWLYVRVEPDCKDKTASGGGEGGEVWVIEMPSMAPLSRRGWKRNTLSPGDKVIVTINPLREGSAPLKDGLKGGLFRNVTMSDGTPVPASDGSSASEDAKN